MKNKVIALLILIALAVPALARTTTTATCRAVITQTGSQIEATMELRDGDELVASWTASGSSRVAIVGDVAVDSGKTYTLTVTGTADGTPFCETTTTKSP